MITKDEIAKFAAYRSLNKSISWSGVQQLYIGPAQHYDAIKLTATSSTHEKQRFEVSWKHAIVLFFL